MNQGKQKDAFAVPMKKLNSYVKLLMIGENVCL